MDKNILMILGVAVIGFALIFFMAQSTNAQASANGAGYGDNQAGSNGNYNAAQGLGSGQQGAVANGQIQDIYIKAQGFGGYDKPEVDVKAGIPVRLHFSADPSAGCGRALFINEFGVQLVSKSGEEQVATFTPTKPGTYQYHCGMYMFVGKLVVA